MFYMSILQYLNHYAEDVKSYASWVKDNTKGGFDRVLCIPVCREETTLPKLLFSVS